MHYSTLIIPAALFLATGAHARPWAQAADGVWTANNVYYNIRGCESPLPSLLLPLPSPFPYLLNGQHHQTIPSYISPAITYQTNAS